MVTLPIRSCLLCISLLTSCEAQGRRPRGDSSKAVPDASGTGVSKDAPDALRIPVDSARTLMLMAAPWFGSTEEEIRLRLGPPEAVRLDPPFGHRAESGDSVVRLEYPGLSIGLYRVLPERRDLLGHVVLSDSSWPNPFLVVRVGASPDAVRAALGTPDVRQDDENEMIWEYSAGENDETIGFRFNGKRLSRIEWTLYID